MDAPAPKFTATQPEVADQSEGSQMPSVPAQRLATEDCGAQATGWGGTTTEWSEAVLPKTLKQKMEMRLMENKISLKKKKQKTFSSKMGTLTVERKEHVSI